MSSAPVSVSADEARRLRTLSAWAIHKSKPGSEIRLGAIVAGRIADRAEHTLAHPTAAAPRQEATR